MDTIVRNTDNIILLRATVIRTIEVIREGRSGYISVENIMRAINNQIPDKREHINRSRIVRTLADIIDSK